MSRRTAHRLASSAEHPYGAVAQERSITRGVRTVCAAALALFIFALVGAPASAHPLTGRMARAASTCAAYDNQAAAQRAADWRDGDGDALLCESLPCPCLNPGGSAPVPPRTPVPTEPSVSCRRPS